MELYIVEIALAFIASCSDGMRPNEALAYGKTDAQLTEAEAKVLYADRRI